jgi:hypothetical protein
MAGALLRLRQRFKEIGDITDLGNRSSIGERNRKGQRRMTLELGLVRVHQ